MSNKLLSIQSLRTIAFILIFLSHCELISTGPAGVSVFLVMSGFLMTISHLKNHRSIADKNIVSNIKFAAGKISRLYPLHLVTLGFTAVIILAESIWKGAHIGELMTKAVYFAANSVLLQSWIPLRDAYYSFNAVSWYLSTIVFSYFMFPWLITVFQERNEKKIRCLGISTISAMIAVPLLFEILNCYYIGNENIVKWATYIFPLYRCGDFIIGMLAGYVFISKQITGGREWCSVLEVFAFLLLIAEVVLYQSGMIPISVMYTIVWIPASVMIVYLFGLSQGIVSRMTANSRLLVWIGNVSGEAFLIHQICIKGVQVFIRNDKLLLAITSLPVSIIATIVWRSLYKKTLSLLDKKI